MEAALVLALFLVPGYIGAVAFTRNAPRNEVADVRFILQVSFWGALNFLAVVPWSGDLLANVALSGGGTLVSAGAGDLFRFALAILIVPAAVGVCARRVFAAERVQEALGVIGLSDRDTIPTAWDMAFRSGGPGAWVYVYVRSLPEPLIGEWGKKSVAGLTPSPHDLFLERRMEWKDEKLVPITATGGVWIPAEEIQFVELLRAEQEEG